MYYAPWVKRCSVESSAICDCFLFLAFVLQFGSTFNCALFKYSPLLSGIIALSASCYPGKAHFTAKHKNGQSEHRQDYSYSFFCEEVEYGSLFVSRPRCLVFKIKAWQFTANPCRQPWDQIGGWTYVVHPVKIWREDIFFKDCAYSVCTYTSIRTAAVHGSYS
jgi:hypothetical protein